MKIYDLHCDSILTIASHGTPVSKYNISSRYPHFQFFAVFVDNIALGKMRETAFQYIEDFKKSFPGVVVVDKTSFDASKNAPVSGLLSLEGASFVDSEALLEKLFEAGIRSFCPSWNNVSRITATNLLSGTPDDFGVTDFGKVIIKRAFDLGMIIDVSHISDNGFRDVARLSELPFIASHSNARSVCRNRRNLTDEEIKEIVSRNGLIGLNIFPPFISETDSFDGIFRQVSHLLSLGAENVLSFGFDIDGTDGMYFPEIPKFGSIHDFIVEKLKEEFSSEIIEKIAYKNAENFLENHFQRS